MQSNYQVSGPRLLLIIGRANDIIIWLLIITIIASVRMLDGERNILHSIESAY